MSLISDRFNRRGTAGIYWTTELDDYNRPTVADIDAATKLACDISDIDGLTGNHTPLIIRRATSTHAIARPGRTSALTPTMLLYDSADDSSTVRPLFDLGNTGYLILAPHGLTGPGDRVEIIPATSAGNRDVWTAQNEGARYEVTLTATAAPVTVEVSP